MKGKVKWWIKEKGYGFIEITETENIFAYLENDDKNREMIKENEEIEFTLEAKNNQQFLHLLTKCEN